MILLGCSDAGPAKYIAELVNRIPDSVIVTNRKNENFFKKSKLITIEEAELLTLKLVVTGTSLNRLEENIDKSLLIFSRQKKIPSVSIVEHWSWYYKRFELGQELLLPDYIILNDKIALEEALYAGLPRNKLKVLGNPSLEMLSIKNRPNKCQKNLRIKYEIPENKKVIFFISEELESSFPTSSKDFLGYNEYNVFNTLKSLLRPKDHLVVKLHPEESNTKFTKEKSHQISILKDCPTEDIVILADAIVGMASMLLLELSIHRDDIISFRPNATKNFIGKQLGVVSDLQSEKELASALRVGVHAKNTIKDQFNGSTDRIVNFLLGTAN